MKRDKIQSIIGRRQFLAAGIAVAGPVVINSLSYGMSQSPSSGQGYREIMKDVMKYRKIDSHGHIRNEKDVYIDHAKIVETLDRLGIEKTAVSFGLHGVDIKPHEFREMNNLVLKAMKEFPNRFIGQCFINPCYGKEALEEIDRCLGEGMVQLGELFEQANINDPLYYPIIEKCIELKIPLMMHTADLTELIRYGYEPRPPGSSSIAENFVEVAKHYPELMLIHAHIGGGGDWEHKCKTLRDSPTVYVDTSGSVHDEAMVDFALKYLGEDRILFACDMSFEAGVGKIMAANLNERQRKKIFFDNYNNLLRKAGNNVD